MTLQVVLPDPVTDPDLAVAALAAAAQRVSAGTVGLLVERVAGVLTLHLHDGASSMRVRVDLAAGRAGSTRRTSLIARAVGGHRGDLVFDATAGLGSDAAELSHLGYRVLACERHPVLALLLREAIARSGSSIGVHGGDAREVLPPLARRERPHAVCLDPMFGAEGVRARARKSAQVLQHLLGPGSPEQDRAMLATAWPCADRVVVKRPRRAPPIAPGVSFTVEGKAVRFDVYLTVGRTPPP